MNRLGALVLAMAALVTGCEGDKVTYSYFLIQARLDPNTVDFELRDRIEACAVVARTALREDTADLRCRRHMVSSELGTFEYTTSLTSGTIKFVLLAVDFNGQRVAEGETRPLEIRVGRTVDMEELVARAVPGAKPEAEPAPGAGDGGTRD